MSVAAPCLCALILPIPFLEHSRSFPPYYLLIDIITRLFKYLSEVATGPLHQINHRTLYACLREVAKRRARVGALGREALAVGRRTGWR